MNIRFHVLRLFFFIFAFICGCKSMSANDSYISRDSTKYMLLLTNNFEVTKIYLYPGEKIKFKYNGQQYKGTLDSVTRQTFYVGGNGYGLDKIRNIKIFNQKNGFKKTAFFSAF